MVTQTEEPQSQLPTSDSTPSSLSKSHSTKRPRAVGFAPDESILGGSILSRT